MTFQFTSDRVTTFLLKYGKVVDLWCEIKCVHAVSVWMPLFRPTNVYKYDVIITSRGPSKNLILILAEIAVREIISLQFVYKSAH